MIVQYVIRDGDTVSLIAARFRTSVNAIMAMNPHLHGVSGRLTPGERLKIPGTGSGMVQQATSGDVPPDVAFPTVQYSPFHGGAEWSAPVYHPYRPEPMWPGHGGPWSSLPTQMPFSVPFTPLPYTVPINPRSFQPYSGHSYDPRMSQAAPRHFDDESMESSWIAESDVDSDWGSPASIRQPRPVSLTAFDEPSDSFASPSMYSMTFESDSMTSASDFAVDEESPSR